jgi:hypothetical protein
MVYLFVRFYTSIDLADSLLEEFQMTCVGTLAANRKGLPLDFKRTDGRAEGSYTVLYDISGKKSIHSWITNTRSGKFQKNTTGTYQQCSRSRQFWYGYDSDPDP